MMLRRANVKWSFLLLPVLLIFTGCPFSPEKDNTPDPPQPSEYKARTSISNVLFNLQHSWEKKNIEAYRDLLSEDYTYVFDPKDVGSGQGIPESWGLADELVSATNLFSNAENADGYRCQTISLDFVSGPVSQSDVDPEWRMVTLSQIQLLVDTRKSDTGDPLMYQVLGDQADLHFRQTNETDPDSGEKLWEITYWKDRPVETPTLAAKN
jgi:hypothetical protein